MPPKKRSAIGRSTPDAKRNKLARALETSEHRDIRLASNRDRINEGRSTEPSSSREERLNADRERHAGRRSAESSARREARLNADRERHTEGRSAESSARREARLTADRERHTQGRSTEPSSSREVRLNADRERHIEERSAESSARREARLNADRERHAEGRSAESLENHQARLNVNRERRANRTPLPDLKYAAFHYEPQRNYHLHPNVVIGNMDKLCQHCKALKFANESPGMCCAGGKVKLPDLSTPPEPLSSLVSGTTRKSKIFLRNIRKYNSCFQMTSFRADKILRDNFMPTFKIQGQIYHQARSLLPMPDIEPKFLQIYFMGNIEDQIEQRCRYITNTDREIVGELEHFFHRHNELVKLFRTALDHMPTDEYSIVIRADKTPTGQHERRFNAPTIDEVAIVIVGEGFERRDIILHRRGGDVQFISETHRCYDGLQYPIIFWQGEDGYHFNIKMVHPMTGEESNKKVSAMNFYSYRLMIRENAENHLLKCRALFHQYIVDMYAKIESERLLYIRLNQGKLRSEEYIHLRDAINNDANIDPNQIGKAFILPATFTGSPRHMHEYAQDAMTYVRAYGRPDLFITFTCNPRWIEIKELLMTGQSPTDRHDITARVFRQKLKMFMNYIVKHHVFGETRCWMYSVEWQKRGLPHAHILIWLKDKITPDQIDDIIVAEIPHQDEDPDLFDVVINNMVHGPCGSLNINSPCMVDGKCTKRFPKIFVAETIHGNDGYPLYRRRSPEDGGRSATVGERIDIDNRWIVPYSPLLSKTFKAHINVEFCNSVKSIKYITKYVNKGSDMAVFEVRNTAGPSDEIKQYQLGRYISSNEAVWRILSFPIHERHPTVTHLAVHLENGQRVYFTANTARERALSPPQTTLTAFFLLCQEDVFARTLLYSEVPKYYTWNASMKKFQRRKQGKAVTGHSNLYTSDALGRVYTVHPTNSECFYLRLLLINVRGPTSFNDLKTVNSQMCATYREACQKLNLLENDAHWDIALSDAADTARPQQIRALFAIILTTCSPSNPEELWEKHKNALSDDILHRVRAANQNQEIPFGQQIYNEALIAIEDICLNISNKLLSQVGMPAPNRDSANILDRDLRQESVYDTDDLACFVQTNIPNMNAEQRAVYNTIMSAISERQGGFFFLDAPGGTGKTFLISLILATLRAERKVALAIASTGIAATLLAGGRTAHSALKLPLNLQINEAPTCNISKSSGMGIILRTCEIIIWDECTMTHKKALEALNATLQDFRGNKKLFGGALILLSGDFRQTLPVIPRSTPADELHACLKSSVLWPHVKKLRLKTNMRVQLMNVESAGRFSEQLLQIGNGQLPIDETTKCVTFPTDFCEIVATKELLISSVFPDIKQNYKNHHWLSVRAILAPKNQDVNEINKNIQEDIEGNERSYLSIDTVMNTDEVVNYPTEFLNSLDLPGLPPHNLVLKVGVPIILLRNINPPKLCNGTRLAVKRLKDNIIEGTILKGNFRGEDVLLPRIPMIPTDLPFDFKRLQFPVRLAFAMTINKSQGQSLEVCGLDLEKPCFSHGQLYVACSRVGNPRNLFIYAPGGKTKNVTYPTALH